MAGGSGEVRLQDGGEFFGGEVWEVANEEEVAFRGGGFSCGFLGFGVGSGG